MPPINIDLILSDRWLLVGALLLVFGVVVFLIALWKFFTCQPAASKPAFAVPDMFDQPPPSEEEKAPDPEIAPLPDLAAEAPAPPAVQESANETPTPEPAGEPIGPPAPTPDTPSPMSPAATAPAATPQQAPDAKPFDMDRTVVLPAGVSEVQAQMEIALAQIKMLNKRVMEMEDLIQILERHAAVRMDSNALKEPPTDPADYLRKLTTLAEHVILLEKEVARLKGDEKRNAAATSRPRPPVAPAGPAKPPILPL